MSGEAENAELTPKQAATLVECIRDMAESAYLAWDATDKDPCEWPAHYRRTLFDLYQWLEEVAGDELEER